MNDPIRIGRVPSGISGLDTIMNGGFLKGGLYIIQGTPGTGKTTLANQICFSHATTGGGQALYITLLAEYHDRMLQHLSNMSFFDITTIPNQIKYLNGYSTLSEQGYAGLRDLMRQEILTHKATILILDGFATAQRQESEVQRFNEFVHELQGVATATDCTMFLLTSAVGVRDTPEYTMVDGIVELSDHLIGWSAESTLQVIKLRGSGYLRGLHAFRISEAGLLVYPRIEALLQRPSRPDIIPVETIPSGLDQLDTMLGGGLPLASTTKVIGPAGVGKTTLGLQFLSRSSTTQPGLLFGFHETPVRINAKVDEICQPLRGLIDSGVVDVVWQPPTDGLLDLYGERLLDGVRRRGVKRLFVDGLNAFQSASVEPARLSQWLTALVNELRVLGVTTVLTLVVPDIIAPFMRSPIDGDFLNLADNLILMRYVEVRSRLHRLVSIIKVRDSNFDSSAHEYVITDQGLRIADTGDSAEAILGQAQHQHDAAPRRDEASQARHGQ
jgi:circadian clock protein KaiC